MSVDAPPITRLGRDRNGKLVVVVGNCGCCERDAEAPQWRDPWGNYDDPLTDEDMRAYVVRLEAQRALALNWLEGRHA